MHDVFPIKITAYIPWLKNVKTIGELNLAVLGWDQAFIDEIGLDIEDLEKKEQDVIVAKAAAKAAVEAKDNALSESMKKMRPKIGVVQLNDDVPNSLRENIGFKVHDTTPSHDEPFVPDGLQVKGLSRGENFIDWNANGNKSGTQYIVECRYGTEGDFQMVDAVPATRYTHYNQTPGVAVYYRISARRGKLQSAFCDPVGIYT